MENGQVGELVLLKPAAFPTGVDAQVVHETYEGAEGVVAVNLKAQTAQKDKLVLYNVLHADLLLLLPGSMR